MAKQKIKIKKKFRCQLYSFTFIIKIYQKLDVYYISEVWYYMVGKFAQQLCNNIDDPTFFVGCSNK
jgi:hypothetical protein